MANNSKLDAILAGLSTIGNTVNSLAERIAAVENGARPQQTVTPTVKRNAPKPAATVSKTVRAVLSNDTATGTLSYIARQGMAAQIGGSAGQIDKSHPFFNCPKDSAPLFAPFKVGQRVAIGTQTTQTTGKDGTVYPPFTTVTSVAPVVKSAPVKTVAAVADDSARLAIRARGVPTAAHPEGCAQCSGPIHGNYTDGLIAVECAMAQFVAQSDADRFDPLSGAGALDFAAWIGTHTIAVARNRDGSKSARKGGDMIAASTAPTTPPVATTSAPKRGRPTGSKNAPKSDAPAAVETVSGSIIRINAAGNNMQITGQKVRWFRAGVNVSYSTLSAGQNVTLFIGTDGTVINVQTSAAPKARR